MNKFKIGIFILLALMLVLIPLVAACAKEEAPPPAPAPVPAPEEEAPPPPPEPIVIRFTCTNPPSDRLMVMMEELKTTIPEATNGQVEFELYPGGQLFGKVEGLVAVKEGDVEMALGGTDLSVISPGWAAIMFLPFLFNDNAHMLRFFETDGFKAMQDKLEAEGFKQVAYMGNPGPSQIYNRLHPIEKLEDLKGVKVWVAPMELVIKSMTALDAQTVTMPAMEFMSALETGMLDGAVFPAHGALVFGFNKTLPYMLDVELGQSAVAFVANTPWWNGLPPDIRETLQSVFTEFGERAQVMHREQLSQVYAAFAETEGTVTTKLTTAEKARWVAAVQSVWEEAMEDEEIRMIVEAAESVR